MHLSFSVTMIFAVTCVLQSLFIVCVDTQTYGDATQLYTDVLNGYNKHVRPVLSQTDILQVNVTYDIIGLQEINEVEGTITLYLQFHYAWIDEKIIWNPYFYNNTYMIALPVDAVWKPELVLANAAGPVVSLESSMTSVKYYPNGLASWFPTGVITLSCLINIKYYPFDTQTCPVMFMISNYFSTEMVLTSTNKEASLEYYVDNGLWQLVETRATVMDTGVQVFQINISLSRRSAFVVIIVIVPIMLLSLLNILVFLLPAESGERMSFTITLLLAQTVFMTIISDNIPHTSSPLSILCYFLGMQVLLSTIICVATILNLRLYHKDDAETIPIWIRRLFRRKLVQVGPERKMDNHNGWTNESEHSKPKTESENGGTMDTMSDNWKFLQKPRNSNFYSSSSAEDTPKDFTWKTLSKSVDMILFIASILYFVIVFVVFAFVAAFQ